MYIVHYTGGQNKTIRPVVYDFIVFKQAAALLYFDKPAGRVSQNRQTHLIVMYFERCNFVLKPDSSPRHKVFGS